MALIYRGRKFDANTAVVNTAASTAQGTYRGASVAFRGAAPSVNNRTATKQYRGVTY